MYFSRVSESYFVFVRLHFLNMKVFQNTLHCFILNLHLFPKYVTEGDILQARCEFLPKEWRPVTDPELTTLVQVGMLEA